MSEKLIKVELTLTEDQLRALSKSLYTFSTLATGRLEVVGELVQEKYIAMGDEYPVGSRPGRALESALKDAKAIIGHPQDGNAGIASERVSIEGRRAYELLKVLSREFAVMHNPNPDLSMRSRDYDGLMESITGDKPPKVSITSEPAKTFSVDDGFSI
jgi:hypothetical protein